MSSKSLETSALNFGSICGFCSNVSESGACWGAGEKFGSRTWRDSISIAQVGAQSAMQKRLCGNPRTVPTTALVMLKRCSVAS